MPIVRRSESANQAPPELIGKRVKQIRKQRGLSIRTLADLAKVNKNTLMRLEKGLPTLPVVLEKVCKALDVYTVSHSDEPSNKPYVVTHNEDGHWLPASRIVPRRAELPIESDALDERQRLASLGYFGMFYRPHHCDFENTNTTMEVAEIYRERPEAYSHPGLEMLYVLSGEVVVRVGPDQFTLSQGESIVFWSEVPHMYGPARPLGRHDVPPSVLMIGFDSLVRPDRERTAFDG